MIRYASCILKMKIVTDFPYFRPEKMKRRQTMIEHSTKGHNPHQSAGKSLSEALLPPQIGSKT